MRIRLTVSPAPSSGAKWLSWSLAKQLAAVVTKALAAFGLAGKGVGSGRTNLDTRNSWERSTTESYR